MPIARVEARGVIGLPGTPPHQTPSRRLDRRGSAPFGRSVEGESGERRGRTPPRGTPGWKRHACLERTQHLNQRTQRPVRFVSLAPVDSANAVIVHPPLNSDGVRVRADRTLQEALAAKRRKRRNDCHDAWQLMAACPFSTRCDARPESLSASLRVFKSASIGKICGRIPRPIAFTCAVHASMNAHHFAARVTPAS